MGAVLAATGASARVGIEVVAHCPAGLDVQMLGNATGDVGGPANMPVRMLHWRVEVQGVHAMSRRQFAERNHAKGFAWALATVERGLRLASPLHVREHNRP
jgi:hypothetical protein